MTQLQLPNSKLLERYVLVAILILAAVLRIICLNADLWYDEILTLTKYSRLPASELVVAFESLNNHVLYSWFAKLSISIFGESAWAMRLPAMLLGLGSIWATWLLVREMAPRHVALFSAFLLAISYHHVWFSQNARGYTGLFFFTIFSCWFLLKTIDRRQDDRRFWIGYALCVFAALATHLSAAFFFVAQGLVVLAFEARHGFKTGQWKIFIHYIMAAISGALLAVAFLAPLFPKIIASIGGVQEVAATVSAAAPQDIAEWRNPLWTIVETLQSFGAIGALIPVALLLGLWGAWKMFKSTPVTTLTFPVAIIVTLILLITLSFRIWPRYFFQDIGFLIAIAVYGAFCLADYASSLVQKFTKIDLPSSVLKVGGGALMVAASVYLLLPNYAYPKQNTSVAMTYIDQHNDMQAPVVTTGLAGVIYSDFTRPDWPFIETVDEVEALLQTSDTVWLVTAFPGHFEAKYPALFAAANIYSAATPPVQFQGSLRGGDIQVWRLQAND